MSGTDLQHKNSLFSFITLHNIKCLVSSIIVFAALYFVIAGTFGGYGRVDANPFVCLLCLLVALLILAYFEGLQVAVVNAQAMPQNQTPQLATSVPRAYLAYMKTFGPGVIERFMIGRQLVVILVVFFISRLTIFPTFPIFLPPILHHTLITSGLPGVMIALTFAQMAPQLVADEYTLRFLNMPGCVSFINVSLWIESLGVFTHFSWIVTRLVTYLNCSNQHNGYNTDSFMTQKLQQIHQQQPQEQNHQMNDDDGNILHISNISTIDQSSNSASELITLDVDDDFEASETASSIDNSEKGNILDLIPMSVALIENRRRLELQQQHQQKQLQEQKMRHLKVKGMNKEIGKQLPIVVPNTPSSELSLFDTRCLPSQVLLIYEVFKHICCASIIIISVVVVTYGLLDHWSVFTGANPVLLFVVLCISWILIFYLEGLQIAILSLQHISDDDISVKFQRTRIVYRLLSLNADNVKRFLIGRQFLVIFTMFTISNITTYDNFSQSLMKSAIVNAAARWGFAGILLTLNFVQMPSQMLAKQYAIEFVNLPGTFVIVYLAMAVESIGVAHCGWVCFASVKYILYTYF